MNPSAIINEANQSQSTKNRQTCTFIVSRKVHFLKVNNKVLLGYQKDNPKGQVHTVLINISFCRPIMFGDCIVLGLISCLPVGHLSAEYRNASAMGTVPDKKDIYRTCWQC